MPPLPLCRLSCALPRLAAADGCFLPRRPFQRPSPATGLTTDGRGASRAVGAAADIGAYERQAAPADFTATSLPSGQAGVAYSYTLATGATGFTYTVTNGSLPSPLLLTNSAGTVTIAGTPAANSTSTFQITASDGTNSVVTQYQLVIGTGSSGPVAPTVTTDTQTAVTHNSATLGGNVTADGGDAVTERGIVWAITANPTTSDNKVANGSGTGAFSATVNGLPSNTLVHVRAYAVNSVNTSYGPDISFTTLQAPVAITSLTRVGPATSNALVVNWTLTFPSPVNTLNSTHFSLTGPAAAGSSITSVTTGTAGLTWSIGVTIGSTDGLLTLRLANASGLTPSISNTLPFDGDSVTIDKTPPTVVSVTRLSPGGQNTNATTVTFRVTYSEPVTLTAPLTTHYQVVPVGGSTIVGTVTGVTGADGTATRDVTVNLTSGTGEFKLRVLD